jgi:hypothetical protein
MSDLAIISHHSVDVVPAIKRGDNFTNHHMLPNGNIGERVTDAESTHMLVRSFWVLTKAGQS